ncbi:hypothetical protein EVAR_70251_1 [Eumeta japonica]|uniref:Uncharacterized protein n=1 Tax=Eumeta variegata TaxID=151549 RepID=A0A4C2A8L9_EUMVA|nr:hypothetical protein EVAR_70251_1 [Eumeta japonica]
MLKIGEVKSRAFQQAHGVAVRYPFVNLKLNHRTKTAVRRRQANGGLGRAAINRPAILASGARKPIRRRAGNAAA